MCYSLNNKFKTSVVLAGLCYLFIFSGCANHAVCPRCLVEMSAKPCQQTTEVVDTVSFCGSNLGTQPNEDPKNKTEPVSRLWDFADIILYVVVSILAALVLKNTGKENKLLSRVSSLIYDSCSSGKRTILRILNRFIRRK